jgi:biotin carboxyl carrier protein
MQKSKCCIVSNVLKLIEHKTEIFFLETRRTDPRKHNVVPLRPSDSDRDPHRLRTVDCPEPMKLINGNSHSRPHPPATHIHKHAHPHTPTHRQTGRQTRTQTHTLTHSHTQTAILHTHTLKLLSTISIAAWNTSIVPVLNRLRRKPAVWREYTNCAKLHDSSMDKLIPPPTSAQAQAQPQAQPQPQPQPQAQAQTQAATQAKTHKKPQAVAQQPPRASTSSVTTTANVVSAPRPPNIPSGYVQLGAILRGPAPGVPAPGMTRPPMMPGGPGAPPVGSPAWMQMMNAAYIPGYPYSRPPPPRPR